MITIISAKFPFLSEEIKTAQIKTIHITPSQSISKGDLLLTVETSNAIIEIPSEIDGLVTDILVKENDIIAIDQDICLLTDLGSSIKNIENIDRNLAVLKTDFDRLIELNYLYVRLIILLDLPFDSSNEVILNKVACLVQKQGKK